ncbi:hypothetical protein ACLBXJ_22430 [Methylobacterium mesophilicum]
MGRAAYAATLHEGGREELDPAFDEVGALADHIDGLGSHLRCLSLFAGWDEPWEVE